MPSNFNPVVFDEQTRLTLDHFSWNFLRASGNAWAMSHVLNPFLVQMIFQNWMVTVIFFMVWEIVEVFALTAFGGYGIFVGDTSDFEPIADSLLGDPFNGLLGIILAFTFVIAFKVPHWMPSMFGRARKVFWRRLALYLALVVSFLPYNAQLELEGHPRPIFVGVYISMILHTIVLSYSWYKFDRTPMEISLFWGGWIGKKHRDQVYLGWITLLILFQYTGTYYITYVYYQVWLIWGSTIIILILFLASQGRLMELFWYWSWEYRKKHYYRNPELQYKDEDFPKEK